MGHQDRGRGQADRLAVNQKTEPLREKLRFNPIRPLGRNDINSAFRRKRISLSGEMELRFRRNVTPFRPMRASKKALFNSSESPERSRRRFFAASCEKGYRPQTLASQNTVGFSKMVLHIVFVFCTPYIFVCKRNVNSSPHSVVFQSNNIYLFNNLTIFADKFHPKLHTNNKCAVLL